MPEPIPTPGGTPHPGAATPLCRNLAELLAETLETFAFVLSMPTDLPGDPPADPLHCTLGFAGAATGRLELILPRGVAAAVSANLLCLPPDDREAIERAEDSARELMNVACGALLARLDPTDLARTTMGLPTVRPATDADWQAARGDPRAIGLDAEGHLVAARVVIEQPAPAVAA